MGGAVESVAIAGHPFLSLGKKVTQKKKRWLHANAPEDHPPTPTDTGVMSGAPCAGIIQIRFRRSVAVGSVATLSARLPELPLR